jgi:hypothetical protein
LTTVEKYVIGVSYAAGEVVFDRAAGPMQSLTRLVSAYDALARPMEGGRKSVATPAAAGEFLVAAPSAAQPLIERAGAGEVICEVISSHPEIFVEWGKQWTGTLPPLDAPVNLAAVAARRSVHTEPRSGAERKP